MGTTRTIETTRTAKTTETAINMEAMGTRKNHGRNRKLKKKTATKRSLNYHHRSSCLLTTLSSTKYLNIPFRMDLNFSSICLSWQMRWAAKWLIVRISWKTNSVWLKVEYLLKVSVFKCILGYSVHWAATSSVGKYERRYIMCLMSYNCKFTLLFQIWTARFVRTDYQSFTTLSS